MQKCLTDFLLSKQKRSFTKYSILKRHRVRPVENLCFSAFLDVIKKKHKSSSLFTHSVDNSLKTPKSSHCLWPAKQPTRPIGQGTRASQRDWLCTKKALIFQPDVPSAFCCKQNKILSLVSHKNHLKKQTWVCNALDYFPWLSSDYELDVLCYNQNSLACFTKTTVLNSTPFTQKQINHQFDAVSLKQKILDSKILQPILQILQPILQPILQIGVRIAFLGSIFFIGVTLAFRLNSAIKNDFNSFIAPVPVSCSLPSYSSSLSNMDMEKSYEFFHENPAIAPASVRSLPFFGVPITSTSCSSGLANISENPANCTSVANTINEKSIISEPSRFSKIKSKLSNLSKSFLSELFINYQSPVNNPFLLRGLSIGINIGQSSNNVSFVTTSIGMNTMNRFSKSPYSSNRVIASLKINLKEVKNLKYLFKSKVVSSIKIEGSVNKLETFLNSKERQMYKNYKTNSSTFKKEEQKLLARLPINDLKNTLIKRALLSFYYNTMGTSGDYMDKVMDFVFYKGHVYRTAAVEYIPAVNDLMKVLYKVNQIEIQTNFAEIDSALALGSNAPKPIITVTTSADTTQEVGGRHWMCQMLSDECLNRQSRVINLINNNAKIFTQNLESRFPEAVKTYNKSIMQYAGPTHFDKTLQNDWTAPSFQEFLVKELIQIQRANSEGHTTWLTIENPTSEAGKELREYIYVEEAMKGFAFFKHETLTSYVDEAQTAYRNEMATLRNYRQIENRFLANHHRIFQQDNLLIQRRELYANKYANEYTNNYANHYANQNANQNAKESPVLDLGITFNLNVIKKNTDYPQISVGHGLVYTMPLEDFYNLCRQAPNVGKYYLSLDFKIH